MDIKKLDEEVYESWKKGEVRTDLSSGTDRHTLTDCEDKVIRSSRDFWIARVREVGNHKSTFLSTPSEWINNFTKWHEDILRILITDQNVLDLGCGWGRMIPFFSKYANTYYGLDFVPDLVEEAKTIAAKYPNCVVGVADARDLNYLEEDRFDIAVGVTVISSFEHYFQEILKQAKRVVKSEGVIVWCEEGWYRVDRVVK